MSLGRFQSVLMARNVNLLFGGNKLVTFDARTFEELGKGKNSRNYIRKLLISLEISSLMFKQARNIKFLTPQSLGAH